MKNSIDAYDLIADINPYNLADLKKVHYEMMKGLNKTLREKGISDENQMSQVQQQVGPRTVTKQSGFCR